MVLAIFPSSFFSLFPCKIAKVCTTAIEATKGERFPQEPGLDGRDFWERELREKS